METNWNKLISRAPAILVRITCRKLLGFATNLTKLSRPDSSDLLELLRPVFEVILGLNVLPFGFESNRGRLHLVCSSSVWNLAGRCVFILAVLLRFLYFVLTGVFNHGSLSEGEAFINLLSASAYALILALHFHSQGHSKEIVAYFNRLSQLSGTEI